MHLSCIVHAAKNTTPRKVTPAPKRSKPKPKMEDGGQRTGRGARAEMGYGGGTRRREARSTYAARSRRMGDGEGPAGRARKGKTHNTNSRNENEKQNFHHPPGPMSHIIPYVDIDLFFSFFFYQQRGAILSSGLSSGSWFALCRLQSAPQKALADSGAASLCLNHGRLLSALSPPWRKTFGDYILD